MSVDIVMATFNGEKYIRNQILSLMAQTYDDWNLIVRDDGSSDGTLNILESFAKSDARINIVKENSGQRLGPGKNFLDLLKYSNAEYVMFCDQDDFWFEKKIEILINSAIEKNADRPALFYCDAYGYSDSEGVIIKDGVSRWNAQTLKDFIFMNSGYQGCSMLFNKSLRHLLNNYKADDFFLHDDVTALMAHVFGDVHFISKKLMLYRQHSNNVTGHVQRSFFLRIKDFRKNPLISSAHFDEKKKFFEAYKESMAADQRSIFEKYLAFPDFKLPRRIYEVVMNEFTFGGEKFRFFVRVLLKKVM